MLKKLLFRTQDRKQLYIAILGAFLGMTFLLTSIHYLIKVNEFGEGTDILGPNTIIVQKEVTTSNVLNLAKTDFSEREIAAMRALPFIEKVKPVITNNFKTYLKTADPRVPKFSTDLFIQSVDKDFLDVKSARWKWNPGDTIVPIILPRDFIVMLNTFMSSSGIPQVSDELAQEIRFQISVRNGDERETYTAKIVGFTNSVSSVLVPESFMVWANKKYGSNEPNKITQLMISGKEGQFGLVESLLKERHLETKNSQEIIGRLKSVVGTLILVVLAISVIAVFVSGLVLIQYLQLLLSRNAYEVRTLVRIGYRRKVLVRLFFQYFTRVFGVVALLGVGAFLLLKLYLDSMFEDGGLYIGKSLTFASIASLVLAYGIFAFFSWVSAVKGIRKTL